MTRIIMGDILQYRNLKNSDQYTAFQKIYNIFLEGRGIIPHFLNYKFIELRDKIDARSAYFINGASPNIGNNTISNNVDRGIDMWSES